MNPTDVVVKTVSVKMERGINLGNYESLRVECQVWADVQTDDVNDVMHRLWGMVEENIAQFVEARYGEAVSMRDEHRYLGVAKKQEE